MRREGDGRSGCGMRRSDFFRRRELDDGRGQDLFWLCGLDCNGARLQVQRRRLVLLLGCPGAWGRSPDDSRRDCHRLSLAVCALVVDGLNGFVGGGAARRGAVGRSYRDEGRFTETPRILQVGIRRRRAEGVLPLGDEGVGAGVVVTYPTGDHVNGLAVRLFCESLHAQCNARRHASLSRHRGILLGTRV